MPADPNARCVCGYRKFRDEKVTADVTASRWIFFDGGSFGGFGSSPFGAYFGAGTGGSGWGLYDLDVAQLNTQLVCESCKRVRSSKVLSSFGVYGSYLFNDNLYILTTSGENLGCLSVRFASSTLGTYYATPTIFLGTPLPLALPTPTDVLPDPPPGGVVATILRVALPDVDDDGLFVVSLVDSCSDTTTPLTTLTLESSVQVHTPREAELDGLPASLIESNLSSTVPVGQFGTGSLMGIPFDKCAAVVEYDARFGTTPDAQGFTNVNSSGGSPDDYALIDGGVLGFDIKNPSFWRKTITLNAVTPAVYLYSKYRVLTSTTGTGMGFETKGIASPGSNGDFVGVRYYQDRDSITANNLPGTTQTELSDALPSRWSQLYSGRDLGGERAFASYDETFFAMDGTTIFSTQPGGGTNPQLRGEFGNTLIIGGGLTGQIRNFIVSAGGRFVRAFFRSYAAVAAPVLRLNLVSDNDAVSPKARFLIRYGSLGLATNPYSYGSLSVGATVSFNNPKNVMVELPITLPSLTAKAPFWFTVERDWNHADDLTGATVHLLAATVRSS